MDRERLHYRPNILDRLTAGERIPIYGGRQGGAFVTKLSADGTALVYSMYLSGSHSAERRRLR